MSSTISCFAVPGVRLPVGGDEAVEVLVLVLVGARRGMVEGRPPLAAQARILSSSVTKSSPSGMTL